MMTNDEKRSLITAIKLDSRFLYDKVVNRRAEYISILSLKRTRAHFKDVFSNKYHSVGLNELKALEEDTVISVMQFYQEVEELKWYLEHTEDLPGTIENQVEKEVKRVERFYDTMCLYLDAELGLVELDVESAV